MKVVAGSIHNRDEAVIISVFHGEMLVTVNLVGVAGGQVYHTFSPNGYCECQSIPATSSCLEVCFCRKHVNMRNQITLCLFRVVFKFLLQLSCLNKTLGDIYVTRCFMQLFRY